MNTLLQISWRMRQWQKCEIGQYGIWRSYVYSIWGLLFWPTLYLMSKMQS